MAADVWDPWAADVEVSELTDRDLAQSRTATMQLSDVNRDLQTLVNQLLEWEGLEERSAVCDRALRVILAKLIDTEQVSFTRTDYGIKYIIPPRGWVSAQEFENRRQLNPVQTGSAGVRIPFSTPPVVHEMARRTVEEDVDENLSELVCEGVKLMAGCQTQTYSVTRLFGTRARREIIQLTMEDLESDQKVTQSDIMEEVTVGRGSVWKGIDALCSYEVLNIEDESANIPHYTPGDTRVMNLLNSWKGYPLADLFGAKGRQRLVAFFLSDADPEKAYSKNQLSNYSGAKNQTVSKHIDELVDSGLVCEVDGTRAINYQVATESAIYDLLNQLDSELKKAAPLRSR